MKFGLIEEKRRKKKPGAFGWFCTLGHGEPKEEIDFFNSAMDTGSPENISSGEGEGMAENLSKKLTLDESLFREVK